MEVPVTIIFRKWNSHWLHILLLTLLQFIQVIAPPMTRQKKTKFVKRGTKLFLIQLIAVNNLIEKSVLNKLCIEIVWFTQCYVISTIYMDLDLIKEIVIKCNKTPKKLHKDTHRQSYSIPEENIYSLEEKEKKLNEKQNITVMTDKTILIVLKCYNSPSSFRLQFNSFCLRLIMSAWMVFS